MRSATMRWRSPFAGRSSSSAMCSSPVCRAPTPTASSRSSSYFGLRLITTALALSLILGVAVAAHFDATTVKVLALLAVGKCAEAVSDVVHGALLRRGRFATLAIALTTNAALSLCGFVVGAALTGHVIWATAGWAAGSVLTLTALNCRTAAALDATHEWPSRGAAAFLTGGLRQKAAIVRLVLTGAAHGCNFDPALAASQRAAIRHSALPRRRGGGHVCGARLSVPARQHRGHCDGTGRLVAVR